MKRSLHSSPQEVDAGDLPPSEHRLLEGISERLSRWKTRDFVSELKKAAGFRRGALMEAASSTDKPTFENTCLPLELLDIEVDAISADFNSLLGALRPPKLAGMEKKIVGLLAQMEAEDMSDNRLALRLRALRRNTGGNLDPRRKKLLDDHYKGFLRSGYYLPEAQRKKLAGIAARLAKLESSYARASSRERKHVIVRDAGQLKGLGRKETSEFREYARRMGREGWAVPLEPTQHQPITSSLKSAALRRRMHEASMKRGRLTSPIAKEILRLRRRMASILGFRDWASLKLSGSFAKKPERVWASLRSISRVAKPLAQKDLSVAKGRGWSKVFDTPLCPLAFLPSEDDSFRGFDPVAVLERGCFEAARRLFGLRFQKVREISLYHADVMLYRVLEKNGATLGFLTVDPWIRRGKEDGAWASHWVTTPGTLPVASIFMNAQRSGCSFSDAKTMFHEFGHALHALFSFGQFPSHWGLEMPSDFAEIPSQLAETWAEYPEIYRRFAPHEAPTLDTLCPKTPREGTGLRQTALLVAAAADMILHSTPKGGGIDDVDRVAARTLDLPVVLAVPRYKAGYFEHVFSSGYDAGYYSYIWTEAKAKNIAKKVSKTGGLSKVVGAALRNGLLEPGGLVGAGSLAWKF